MSTDFINRNWANKVFTNTISSISFKEYSHRSPFHFDAYLCREWYRPRTNQKLSLHLIFFTSYKSQGLVSYRSHKLFSLPAVFISWSEKRPWWKAVLIILSKVIASQGFWSLENVRLNFRWTATVSYIVFLLSQVVPTLASSFYSWSRADIF